MCKLPWNDIIPEGNKETKEPAKVIEHVRNYAKYFYAVTGRKVSIDDIIAMSEKVYNFQRIFNLRMGFGKREHDNIPYRAMGPVTKEEYESLLLMPERQKHDNLKNLEGAKDHIISHQDFPHIIPEMNDLALEPG